MCLALLFVWGGIAVPPLIAQEEEGRLESDIPERVQIPVLDVTTIHLVPRERFNDAARPTIGEPHGVYAKERAWNLPPAEQLGRMLPSETPQPPDWQVRLDLAPRLPGSFVYEALLLRAFPQGYSMAHLAQRFLSGSETTDGRHYRVSRLRGAVDYHHRRGAYLHADVDYLDKDLEWQLAETPETATSEPSGSQRRDASLLEVMAQWTEPVGRASRFNTFVDFTAYQRRTREEESERSTDVRVHTQLTTPRPFLYPLRVGAIAEFYSGEETRYADALWNTTLLRVYVRDSLIHLGPLLADAQWELATLREPEGEGTKRFYYPNPQLACTTQIRQNLTWRLAGGRLVERARIRTLYADQDYIVIQPQLKTQKTWYGETSLHFGPRGINGVIKAGVERTDDLTVLVPLQGADVLAWRPAAMDARIVYAALRLGWRWTPSLQFSAYYRHEAHTPIRFEGQTPRHIPFRPRDRAEIGLIYEGSGWRFGGTVHYIGRRYVSTSEEETLAAYWLFQPEARYRVGESTEIYARARFSVGTYQHVPRYDLPQHVADLGMRLRF